MSTIEERSKEFAKNRILTSNYDEHIIAQKAYETGYNDAIKDAARFLKEGIFDYPWYDVDVGDFTVEDIINDFNKYINTTR